MSSGVPTSRISPHTTGHVFTCDGSLLRVDIIAGRWVATRFAPNLVITESVVGTDESVHQQIARWL
jgi:hypothetical protein